MKVLMLAVNTVHIVNPKGNDLYQELYQELLDKGLAYKCYCTEEELEAEREGQVERNETPKYSGKCKHLTEEEQAELVAQGRKPSIRFAVPAGRSLLSKIWSRMRFHLKRMALVILLSLKKMAFQLITLQWPSMIT